MADDRGFSNGWELAADLWMVPQQASPAGNDRFLGISNRGFSYPQRIFDHGTRAVTRHVHSWMKVGLPGSILVEQSLEKGVTSMKFLWC